MSSAGRGGKKALEMRPLLLTLDTFAAGEKYWVLLAYWPLRDVDFVFKCAECSQQVPMTRLPSIK